MTQKILPVNAGIVTQETYYNCGPATTQNLIWAKTQTVVAEGQLARELGTSVNGTDSIEYLDRVLGAHLGVNHATEWVFNDPPTAGQVATFWDRLRAAVDHGYGVGMNWIAPPSNYPRGVGGSVSPSYGGGTVYHYTAAVGYDDVNRWVFVADSGFNPKTYWITLDQCMSLIAGKGYTYPVEFAGAPAPGPAPSGPVFGIDVSNHQGDFNFAGAAAEGYRFATHKVIEGTGYIDPFWPRARAEMAKHFPGRFGGYVFCRTNTSPAAEADFMMARLGDPAIPVQIDYEDTTNGGSGADLAARVQAYRDRGAKLLPVYLPRWFWRDHMGSPDLSFLADVGLWNSNYVSGTGYGSALYDPASAGWQGFGGAQVAILQFTERAQVTDQTIDANAVRDDATLGRIFDAPAPAVNLIDEAAQVAASWLGARLTVGEADTRPPGSGKYAAFDNGTVYWKTGTNFAMPVPRGGLLEAYAARDYEAGPLGFPVRGHTVLDGGGVQAFEGGILYRQNGAEHGYMVHGAIGDRYAAAGWEAGPWGWPTSDETDGPDGTKVQTFQNVTATWSPDGVVLAKKEK